VSILPLEVGQPMWQPSTSKARRSIESINPELTDWQFVSVPWHTTISFEVSVKQDGVVYAFCGPNKNKTKRDLVGDEEADKWEAVAGAIRSARDHLCFRRKVAAGEIIKLHGFELQLAAKSIELVRNGKAASATQPTAPKPTPAVVAPVTAPQTGQPWINSLGMKFVPVPGTAVLFSIWDTRVQDYQAYVAATGHTNEAKNTPPFEQGPTHPVAFIGWIGCKAFCAWLTEKERREGKISAEQIYRLPTDLEWSTAVGLRNETGDTAAERNGKIRDVYPWGNTWPPPRGAGNFGSKLHVDDFSNTSPVGSFPPNRFGLYDMSGNVHQWCDEVENGMHIMRGASWKTGRPEDALLSHRWLWLGATFRDPGFGFRCVLAKAVTGAANSPASIGKTE